jgi:hypothetical protein
VEVVLILIAILAVAVMAVVLAGPRSRRQRARPPIRRRGGVRREDPMADAVLRHSEALDPGEVAVEELRLRAQANRVAAAAHERDARGAGGAGEAGRLEAEGHRNAAAEHARAADELERRAALGEPPPPPPATR